MKLGFLESLRQAVTDKRREVDQIVADQRFLIRNDLYLVDHYAANTRGNLAGRIRQSIDPRLASGTRNGARSEIPRLVVRAAFLTMEARKQKHS